LPAGGIEWMRAGGGVWHGGGTGESGRTRGFQLWIALPPELELGTSESVYLSPEVIPHDGPARVLLGSYAWPRARSRRITPGLSQLFLNRRKGRFARENEAAGAADAAPESPCRYLAGARAGLFFVLRTLA